MIKNLTASTTSKPGLAGTYPKAVLKGSVDESPLERKEPAGRSKLAALLKKKPVVDGNKDFSVKSSPVTFFDPHAFAAASADLKIAQTNLSVANAKARKYQSNLKRAGRQAAVGGIAAIVTLFIPSVGQIPAAILGVYAGAQVLLTCYWGIRSAAQNKTIKIAKRELAEAQSKVEQTRPPLKQIALHAPGVAIDSPVLMSERTVLNVPDEALSTPTDTTVTGTTAMDTTMGALDILDGVADSTGYGLDWLGGRITPNIGAGSEEGNDANLDANVEQGVDASGQGPGNSGGENVGGTDTPGPGNSGGENVGGTDTPGPGNSGGGGVGDTDTQGPGNSGDENVGGTDTPPGNSGGEIVAALDTHVRGNFAEGHRPL